MILKRYRAYPVVAWLIVSGVAVPAVEQLQTNACRSVHLRYVVPAAGVAFYNEVRVTDSAPGTYVCIVGFDRGYFGMQELDDGRKVILFSVWDPGDQNQPDSVEVQRRVRVLEQAPEVRVQRFGGEGTGAQAFFNYDWRCGTTYRFGVHATVADKRTAFAAYFFTPETKTWKHLATFQTTLDEVGLCNPYSFIEDFRRTRESARQSRQAYFGRTRLKLNDGQWIAVTRVRFTGDANPSINIDAGVMDGEFFLATGGAIQNTHTPLGKSMALSPQHSTAALPVEAFGLR